MLNRVIIQGRMTKDPEPRFTNDGTVVLNITLATHRFRKDANGNDIVDFFDVTLWRQSAKFVSDYCKKGAMLVIEGRLQTNTYQPVNSDEHVKRIFIECDNVEVITYGAL